ncbi:MAG: DUF3791 domain-containing protein [Spirochaetaceae bacterium]|nr:DUF3791 domain-containing protein [Spirochaetaceae bacterium]
MNNDKVIEFTSFCIEMYAQKEHISGSRVMQIFMANGIITYLSNNYEALHTQGINYILPLIRQRIGK